MRVDEFEEKVWELEGIRVVVRGGVDKVVGRYNFNKSATETWSITEWLNNRIRPRLRKKKVVVIDGSGEQPHGRTLLRSVRGSYSRE